MGHSLVEAEQTFRPVQCVTDAEVWFAEMLKLRPFQKFLLPRSPSKPSGLGAILIFSRFIGFLFLNVGETVSFGPSFFESPADVEHWAVIPLDRRLI